MEYELTLHATSGLLIDYSSCLKRKKISLIDLRLEQSCERACYSHKAERFVKFGEQGVERKNALRKFQWKARGCEFASQCLKTVGNGCESPGD